MLLKYRPEDKAAKKERLVKRAQAEADGKPVEAKKPIVVKYGLNHVTYLIEQVLCLIIDALICILSHAELYQTDIVLCFGGRIKLSLL